jgi:hypothetical protein
VQQGLSWSDATWALFTPSSSRLFDPRTPLPLFPPQAVTAAEFYIAPAFYGAAITFKSSWPAPKHNRVSFSSGTIFGFPIMILNSFQYFTFFMIFPSSMAKVIAPL